MSPRKESDLHSQLRRLMFYPLNYEEKNNKHFLECLLKITDKKQKVKAN